MFRVNQIIGPKGRQLLSTLKGRVLESYEAVLACGEPWQAVRLHTDTSSLDITCQLETITLDAAGETDEYGVVRVTPCEEDVLSIPDINEPPIHVGIGKEISRIGLLNWEAMISYEGKPISDQTFTQAVCLQFEDGEWLVFDQVNFFSEQLYVKRGFDLALLLSSQRDAFTFEPTEPESGEFSEEICWL